MVVVAVRTHNEGVEDYAAKLRQSGITYFGAQSNSGFEMYKSLEHRADVQGRKFSYSGPQRFSDFN